MFKNYLTTALRKLLRRKGHSIINVAGLAFGLACCLIIFQYVAFEYNFDSFNTNAPNLYRVTQTTVRSGGAPEIEALNGYALGPALAQNVPEVVLFTRIHPDYTDPVISNSAQPQKVFEEKRVYYADPASGCFLSRFCFSARWPAATRRFCFRHIGSARFSRTPCASAARTPSAAC